MRIAAPFVILALALAFIVRMDVVLPRADLVFVNRGEVFTLDPQRMSWLQDFRMAYSLYEGLLRWDNSDFSVRPAGSVALPEISADGLAYTFHLRDDARWSNGDPVTAHDFAFAWMRALLPDTAADYSMMFFAIEGGEDFFSWRREALKSFAQSGSDAVELWNETERRFRDMVGIDVVDDRTLRIRLRRPVPYLTDLMAFPVFYPVHRPCVEGWAVDDETAATIREKGWHAVATPGFENRRWVGLDPKSGAYTQQHGWTQPEHHVGNGPHILVQWRYKRGVRLELNPHYHSPEIVRSRTVDCLSIEDANTGVLAFESGRLDWLSEVSVEYQADMLAQRQAYEDRYASELQSLLAQGMSMDQALASLPAPGPGERRNIHVFPTFGTDFYSFNCRPQLVDGRDNPFHDARVRRAFVLATDRARLVREVTRLNEPVATTLIPPNSIPGYESPDGLGFDPNRAREELKAGGWFDRNGDGLVEDEQGKEFITIDLLYSSNTPRYVSLSLALREMWQRELGVRIELRAKESKFFKEDLIRGNFMIARGRWSGDYTDPTTFLDICRTGDGNNDRGYSNPRVDALLDQAALERDPAKRMAILSECERILFAEEVPMLVLCQLVQLYMYEPGQIRGLTTHPRLVQYLWQIEVE